MIARPKDLSIVGMPAGSGDHRERNPDDADHAQLHLLRLPSRRGERHCVEALIDKVDRCSSSCPRLTRARSEPDLRPRIQSWLTAAGLHQVSFDGDPEPFGVGVASLTRPEPALRLLPQRLFTFLD